MKDAGDGLATARLVLRRVTPNDADWIERLHADPRVMQYMGGVKTPEAAREIMRERMLDYYAQHPRLGVWATQERATGDVVGIHLLNHIRGEPLIQVGYLLFPQYWGRGYATEMSIALLRYGFVDLGLDRIHAITTIPHLVSQRVLSKAGLHRHGDRAFAAYEGGAALAFFLREQRDWLAEFGKAPP